MMRTDLLEWAKNEYIYVLCEYSPKGIHCKEASQSDGHCDTSYECQSAFLLNACPMDSCTKWSWQQEWRRCMSSTICVSAYQG